MHVPRIQKAHIIWGLLASSVRNLLEKVGDLRDIAILFQSYFGIFDIYWSVLNLVKLSRTIILYLFKGLLIRNLLRIHIFFLKSRKDIFGGTCGLSIPEIPMSSEALIIHVIFIFCCFLILFNGNSWVQKLFKIFLLFHKIDLIHQLIVGNSYFAYISDMFLYKFFENWQFQNVNQLADSQIKSFLCQLPIGYISHWFSNSKERKYLDHFDPPSIPTMTYCSAGVKYVWVTRSFDTALLY